MGQGFKPSQQLSYIPILVEVPLPPTPGLPYSKYCAGYAWNAAAFSHTGGGCCKQWSGNSLIQKRAGKWARVNFRKDFWGCYYGTGGEGGGNLAKRLSLLRCSCFQILYTCQVWVHRTVLTKHLLIWSMMVFMICEMIWAKDTMRKMRQKRYDSSAWIVSGGRDTPPKRGTFGGLQPSGAHNRQRAISMRLCHGVFTY